MRKRYTDKVLHFQVIQHERLKELAKLKGIPMATWVYAKIDEEWSRIFGQEAHLKEKIDALLNEIGELTATRNALSESVVVPLAKRKIK